MTIDEALQRQQKDRIAISDLKAAKERLLLQTARRLKELGAFTLPIDQGMPGIEVTEGGDVILLFTWGFGRLDATASPTLFDQFDKRLPAYLEAVARRNELQKQNLVNDIVRISAVSGIAHEDTGLEEEPRPEPEPMNCYPIPELPRGEGAQNDW